MKKIIFSLFCLLTMLTSAFAQLQPRETFGAFVTGLPQASVLNSTDSLYILQGGVSKSIPGSFFGAGFGFVGSTIVNNFACVGPGVPSTLVDCGVSLTSVNSWSSLQNFNGGATSLTRSPGDSTTNLATTAFVAAALTPPFVLSLNSSSLPTFLPFTDLLHVGGANNTGVFVQFDAFGTAGGHNAADHIIFNTARGTLASPTAVGTSIDLSPAYPGTGDYFGFVGGTGYDGTAYSAATGSGIAFRPSQQWSVGSHGADVMIGTTVNGSTSMLFSFLFQGGAVFTINKNTVAPETATAGSGLQLVGPDSGPATYGVDVYGNSGFFVGRRSDGTLSVSKSAVGANEQIFSLGSSAWDGSTYSTAAATIDFFTNSAQTGSDHSAYFRFRAVPVGSTSSVEVARLNSSGGLSLGVTTDSGTGTLQLKKQSFSSLLSCSSTTEGAVASVTDSTTATWGATITGSSTNHVMAYCDGTNWTVAGK